jgi:hypothetical protein
LRRSKRNRKGPATLIATSYYVIKNCCLAKPTFSQISAEYAFVFYVVAFYIFFYPFRVRLWVHALRDDSQFAPIDDKYN